MDWLGLPVEIWDYIFSFLKGHSFPHKELSLTCQHFHSLVQYVELCSCSWCTIEQVIASTVGLPRGEVKRALKRNNNNMITAIAELEQTKLLDSCVISDLV